MIIGVNTASSQSGRAYCADLMQRGYTIHGFSHESANGQSFVNAVNELEGIFLDRPQNSNNEKKTFLNIGKNIINHDLEMLVNSADYIILAEPSIYFIDSVREMKRFGLLEKKIPLILSPSRSFSTPYIWKELSDMYPVVSFSTCPYSCKAPRPDTAYIKRRKRNWIASLEGEFTLSQIAELGQLFPQAIFNRKPITTSIGNIGAIFHPSSYLLNYEEIKRREKDGEVFSFYMDGIAARPDVGEVLEGIDQMRLQIASKMGFGVFGLKENPLDDEWQLLMNNIRKSEADKKTIAELRKVRHDGLKKLNESIPSCQHWLDYTYGVSRIEGESLSSAISRTPTYQKNSVPQKRYVDEDIATGLIPLTSVAKRLKIDTKHADYVLALCDELVPDREKKYDRKLNEFTNDYLKKYLLGDFFAIRD